MLAACGGGNKTTTITNTVTEALPIFLLAPEGVSFDPIRDRCDQAKRHFCLENHAAEAIHLASLALKQSEKHFVLGALDLGLTPETVQGQKIDSGMRFCFDVEHHPLSPGVHNADIALGLVELSEPLTLTIGGGADFQARDKEDFFAGPQIKIDFLFVIDKSPAMAPVKQIVKDRLLSVFDQIELRTDYHIAVISAEDVETGAFHPLDPSATKVISRTLKDPKTSFGAIIDELDIGSGLTHNGFMSAFYAFETRGFGTDFFRDDATTFLIFIADTDDQSSGEPALFAAFYRDAREANRAMADMNPMFFFSPVLGTAVLARMPPAGDCSGGVIDFPPRYSQAVSMLGGFPTPLCAPDWSQTLGPIPPPIMVQAVMLGRTPKTSTLQVELIAPDGNISILRSQDWMYDPNNRILSLTAQPPQGTTVEVSYETQCP